MKPNHSWAGWRVCWMVVVAGAVLTGGPWCRSGAAEAARGTWVYVGTYTGGNNPTSRGIYLCELDPGHGTLSVQGLVAEIAHPSFLALHPQGRFLYAVNETGDFGGQKTGAVSAFAIDGQTGKLTLLNQQPSGGNGPCHLVLDKSGSHVLVANYGGGSVAVLPVGEDGRLGTATAVVQHHGSSVNPRRQESPHAHSINLDPAGRFAMVADLGLDQVLSYRFDPRAGTLQPNDPPSVSLRPGAGPRHFAFHPSGRSAYVINEMQSTVTAFRYEPRKGRLTEIQTLSSLPPGVSGDNSTAEVQVHPSGRFVYGSNRGHNSIAVYAVKDRAGTLEWVENESTQGKTPRNFGIDPSGRYLLAANQQSHSIVVFRIDGKTGALEPAGTRAEVPAPVCVKFLK